jgi:hypothetical protein
VRVGMNHRERSRHAAGPTFAAQCGLLLRHGT